MANVDRPGGLKPVEYLSGAKWTGAGHVYCIPSTDASLAYAIGDPVVWAGSSDGRGVPTITLATAGAGSTVLGAIVSIGALDYGSTFGVPQESPMVIPVVKTHNYYVLVADDPDIIFEIQEVSGGTALTATEVGLNADLVSGTNNGYVSGWEVNNAGEGVGATVQLRLLGLVQRSDNAFGEHAKWRVLINYHSLRAGNVGL
jgi:hypothetical protein